MKTQNTYDAQTAKIIARIAENMPEMSGEVMQGWIENPRGLKKALAEALCPPTPAVQNSTLLRVDRSHPFNPEKFIGKGWKIVEEDERSLALSEIDLSKIDLLSTLKSGEERVAGDEHLARLKKTKAVRLDAKIFQRVWENKESIPESWKEKFVFFDGTFLEIPGGGRCALYLRWFGKLWYWFCYWQGNYRGAGCASAVLASS